MGFAGLGNEIESPSQGRNIAPAVTVRFAVNRASPIGMYSINALARALTGEIDQVGKSSSLRRRMTTA